MTSNWILYTTIFQELNNHPLPLLEHVSADVHDSKIPRIRHMCLLSNNSLWYRYVDKIVSFTTFLKIERI